MDGQQRMITACRTLGGTLEGADASVTVLDDKVLVEDGAVYRWLRAHHLRGRGLTHIAIGIGVLPLRWWQQARAFSSPASVIQFIRDADLHGSSSVLADLCRQLPGGSLAMDQAGRERLVAYAILCGQAWVLDVRRMPNPYVTKTSPTVFSMLNRHFGTFIDFAFLSSSEGGQWLRGYVPMKAKTGHVAGASGMTVATGFDIGQRSRNELQHEFRLPSDLIRILLPFVGVHMTGMSKVQVVDQVAKLGPVPILSKAQADMLDEAVMYEILDQAVTAWDSIRGSGVPRFVALPSNWQTVWFSRFYQEGKGRQLGMAAAFRADATAGRWREAVTDLRNYTQYTDRTNKEADFLQTSLPPAPAGSVDSDAGTTHAP